MKLLTGTKLKSLPKFNWVEDFIYYDGALLSLWKTDDSSFHLFCWVDCDSSSNRWCIIPVEATTLHKFTSGKITLLDVLKESAEITVFDTKPPFEAVNITLTDWKLLPSEYLPTNDSYLGK